MTKDEALKLAMEKFEFMNHVDSIFEGEFDFQINAIKEALANDALEKKAENARELGLMPYDGVDYEPQRTWVNATTWRGLTDEEIYSVLENLQVMYNRPPTTDSRIIFARAIEAALRSKNDTHR